MPIYEYECDECGHQFEAIQKMSDDVLTQCPECKQKTLRKLVSAAAFRLKGKGWYETDFKDGKKKNLSASESKAAADNKAETKSTDKTSSSSSGSESAKPAKSAGKNTGEKK